MTGVIVLFSALALVLLAWVLHVNAKDREALEKELDEEFAEDAEQRK